MSADQSDGGTIINTTYLFNVPNQTNVGSFGTIDHCTFTVTQPESLFMRGDVAAWHLWVFVWDEPNGLLEVSIDNGTFQTTPFPGPVYSGSLPFLVGALNGYYSLYGNICGVAVWKARALSQTDVGLLWNNYGVSGIGLPYSSC